MSPQSGFTWMWSRIPVEGSSRLQKVDSWDSCLDRISVIMFHLCLTQRMCCSCFEIWMNCDLIYPSSLKFLLPSLFTFVSHWHYPLISFAGWIQIARGFQSDIGSRIQKPFDTVQRVLLWISEARIQREEGVSCRGVACPYLIWDMRLVLAISIPSKICIVFDLLINYVSLYFDRPSWYR